MVCLSCSTIFFKHSFLELTDNHLRKQIVKKSIYCFAWKLYQWQLGRLSQGIAWHTRPRSSHWVSFVLHWTPIIITVMSLLILVLLTHYFSWDIDHHFNFNEFQLNNVQYNVFTLESTNLDALKHNSTTTQMITLLGIWYRYIGKCKAKILLMLFYTFFSKYIARTQIGRGVSYSKMLPETFNLLKGTTATLVGT